MGGEVSLLEQAYGLKWHSARDIAIEAYGDEVTYWEEYWRERKPRMNRTKRKIFKHWSER
jgi:hypothetical protein